MGEEIHQRLAKAITTSVAFVSFDYFTTIGKLCAAALSIALFAEWMWKRVIKPMCLRRAWIKRKR